MTPTPTTQQDDQDVHKGAVEGDKPADEQQSNQSGTGLDENGLPDDPVATAQDANGANADKSQG